MYRLTLTDYLITILIILVLAFGAAHLMQRWLTAVTTETSTRMQRVERDY